MNSPNTSIPYVPEGTLDPAAGLNDAIDVLDVLVQTGVISMALTAPPGSPIDGDLYVPAAPATGAWSGLAGYVVRYRSEGAFWQSFTPGVQVKFLLNLDDLNFYRFDAGSSPGAWSLAAGLGDAPIDGEAYARRDGTWETIPDPLTVQDENSPPTLETEVDQLTFGGFVEVTNPAPGEVRVEIPGGLVIQNEESPPLVVSALTLVIGDNLTLTDEGGGAARIEGENGGGGGGGGNLTPDSHPESADDMDDEFEDTGSLDPKWSWLNQGSASETIAQGAAQLVSTTGVDTMSILAQAAPATPWRVRAKVYPFVQANFAHCGLAVYNSGNSRAITLDCQWNGSSQLGCFRYTNLTTFLNTVVSAVPLPGGLGVPVYFEIENDGTNLLFRYSITGYDDQFTLFASEPLATHIVAVTDIGLSVNPGGAASLARLFSDWFRRMA